MIALKKYEKHIFYLLAGFNVCAFLALTKDVALIPWKLLYAVVMLCLFAFIKSKNDLMLLLSISSTVGLIGLYGVTDNMMVLTPAIVYAIIVTSYCKYKTFR